MPGRVQSRERGLRGARWYVWPSLPLMVLVSVPLLAPVAVHAQQPVIVVMAHDVGNAAPLSGVRVTLDHQLLPDTTDASGTVRLTGVAPGLHVIGLRLLGYAPDSETVTVIGSGSSTVDVRLRSTARTLPRVKATAESEDEWIDHFDERRAKGGGFFFDRAQIDSSQTRTLDILLRGGTTAHLIPGPAGAMYLASHSGMLNALMKPKPCWVEVWYDGVLIFNPNDNPQPQYNPPPDLGHYLSHELEAVEFYPNPATIPIQFRTGTPSCGALVLWSRKH